MIAIRKHTYRAAGCKHLYYGIVPARWEERRKGFAKVVSAALILLCLEEGLYPSWDAQNMISVHLAEKLGYELDHEYMVYEVASDERTH